MIGEFLSRAASKEATTVEDEVTFCSVLERGALERGRTYDRRDSEVLLLSILEEC